MTVSLIGLIRPLRPINGELEPRNWHAHNLRSTLSFVDLSQGENLSTTCFLRLCFELFLNVVIIFFIFIIVRTSIMKGSGGEHMNQDCIIFTATILSLNFACLNYDGPPAHWLSFLSLMSPPTQKGRRKASFQPHLSPCSPKNYQSHAQLRPHNQPLPVHVKVTPIKEPSQRLAKEAAEGISTDMYSLIPELDNEPPASKRGSP